MRPLVFGIGLVAATCAAMAIYTGTTSRRVEAPDRLPVVVVRGSRMGGDVVPISQRGTPVAHVDENPDVSKSSSTRPTSLTGSEEKELSDMTSAPYAEPRDAAWAEPSEQGLINQTRNMAIFANGKTKVFCGSTKCVLSVQTEGRQSDFNIESAMRAFSSIRHSDANTFSMETNRVYNLKQSDGSTVFKVELLRSDLM